MEAGGEATGGGHSTFLTAAAPGAKVCSRLGTRFMLASIVSWGWLGAGRRRSSLPPARSPQIARWDEGLDAFQITSLCTARQCRSFPRPPEAERQAEGKVKQGGTYLGIADSYTHKVMEGETSRSGQFPRE